MKFHVAIKKENLLVLYTGPEICRDMSKSEMRTDLPRTPLWGSVRRPRDLGRDAGSQDLGLPGMALQAACREEGRESHLYSMRRH